MTRTERIKAARERVAEAKAKVAEVERLRTSAEANHVAVRAELDRIHKAASRRPAAVARPGETLYWPNGLALSIGYTDPKLREPLGTNARKWAEAVASGAIGVSVNSVAMKAKGFVQRARYLSRADVRAIEAAKKREAKARDIYVAATKATRSAILDAWTNGEKVPLEDVAALVGRYGAAKAKEVHVPPTWEVERLVRSVEIAEKHLLFVQGKLPEGTDCMCNECVTERTNAHREALAKVVAKAPKVRYTCPACHVVVVGAVLPKEDDDGNTHDSVACPRRYCGRVARLAGLKVRKMPARTPVGEVTEEAA